MLFTTQKHIEADGSMSCQSGYNPERHLWQSVLVTALNDYCHEYHCQRELTKKAIAKKTQIPNRKPEMVLQEMRTYLRSRDGRLVLRMAGRELPKPEVIEAWVKAAVKSGNSRYC